MDVTYHHSALMLDVSIESSTTTGGLVSKKTSGTRSFCRRSRYGCLGTYKGRVRLVAEGKMDGQQRCDSDGWWGFFHVFFWNLKML